MWVFESYSVPPYLQVEGSTFPLPSPIVRVALWAVEVLPDESLATIWMV